MKTDAITRAYAGLSNPERAALAFKYLCDGNELEMTRIMDTVPVGRKIGMHPDYLDAYDRLFAVASWWAIERWKAFARYLAARGGAVVACDYEDRTWADRSQRAAEQWESLLMALELALETIGPEQGLDPDAVRKLAGCGRFEPVFIESPEPEHTAEAKAALRQFFTA